MLKRIILVLLLTVSISQTAQAYRLDSSLSKQVIELAEQGNAMMQCAFAECLAAGDCESISQDYVKARKWYEMAATQGHSKAQSNLGIMYYEGKGVRQNYIKAKEWFEKAVSQDYVPAQYNLGLMYANGKGVQQNVEIARALFEKAAMQNFPQAQQILGAMYEKGQGVKQDNATAKEWFGKACDNGLQDGCEAYRRLNEKGF